MEILQEQSTSYVEWKRSSRTLAHTRWENKVCVFFKPFSSMTFRHLSHISKRLIYQIILCFHVSIVVRCLSSSDKLSVYKTLRFELILTNKRTREFINDEKMMSKVLKFEWNFGFDDPKIQRLSSLISNIIKSSLHSHFTPNHHTTRYSINSSTRGVRVTMMIHQRFLSHLQHHFDQTWRRRSRCIELMKFWKFRSKYCDHFSCVYRTWKVIVVSLNAYWIEHTLFQPLFFTDCWLVLIHDVSVLMMWFDNRSRKHRKSFHLSKHEGGSNVPAQGRWMSVTQIN